MKQYKHPKLGRETFVPKYTWLGRWTVESTAYCIKDRWAEFYTDLQLLALWFEEVEEEKDWIDSAIQEMEKYFTYNETGICLTSMPPQYPRYNKTDLRQVIEKYMPKQKKFTIREVEDYYRKIEEWLDKWVVEHNKENKIDVLIISAITGFLRDHDLLEE